MYRPSLDHAPVCGLRQRCESISRIRYLLNQGQGGAFRGIFRSTNADRHGLDHALALGNGQSCRVAMISAPKTWTTLFNGIPARKQFHVETI